MKMLKLNKIFNVDVEQNLKLILIKLNLKIKLDVIYVLRKHLNQSLL